MSIILDALKKADSAKVKKDQEESKVEGSSAGMFKPGKASSSQKIIFSSRLRGMLVAVVVVLGLACASLLVFGPNLKHVFVNANVPKADSMAQTSQVLDPKIAEQAEQEKMDQKAIKLQESAILNFQNGNYEQSVVEYKELVELLSSDPEVYNNYGVALKKLGKNKEALLAYETALALKADYPEVLNNMAVINMAENNYNEARRHLERALELDPDYLDPQLHLALCLEKMGDYESSVKYYQSFLEKSLGKVEKRLRVQVESRLEHLKEDL